jgi:hypothetical protein
VRTVLDPTSERAPATRGVNARPASLAGRTVALLDISRRVATCCSTGWRSGCAPTA